jgi:hypothetical protein
MLAINPASQTFTPDQQYDAVVSYWDTPFLPLYGGVASGGIPMWVREPKGDGSPITLLQTALASAAAGSLKATFTGHAASNAVVTNGRTPSLVGYWAGGAPSAHGVTTRGQVAYLFEATYRSVAARAWFADDNPTSLQLLLGGQGWMRVVKQSGASYTDLGSYTLREQDFLTGGLTRTDTFTLAAGERLLIAYVQTAADPWGGFVVKALTTADTSAAAVRAAPVITCGLMDDGTPPVEHTFRLVKDIELERTRGQSPRLVLEVPLTNMDATDGVGWEWVPDVGGVLQRLRYYDGTNAPVTVKPGRLLRLTGGFTLPGGAVDAGEMPALLTGVIDDIQATDQGTAQILVAGFEQRLVDQFIKNFPDKIAYMTRNYTRLKGTSEPVYDITAFDNWPMEAAVTECLLRAGFCESQLRTPLTVPLADGTTATTVTLGGTERFTTFRARQLGGTPLLLERSVHYGNTGLAFTENTPHDDKYVFGPENTKDIWSQIQSMTDRYGYDFRFTETGACWLQPRNNAHRVIDLTTSLGGGGTVARNPSAYGGTYIQYTGTPTGLTQTVTAARIDLVVGRGASHGAWTYSVTRQADSTVVASGTIDPSTGVGGADEFFYDFRSTTSGLNSCVATLFSGFHDTYVVTLSATGGAATRWLDSLHLYHTDATTPLYPAAFSTDQNAMGVKPSAAANEMRNLVFVVGRRRAVVTDSEKLDTNPNNPQGEFVVQVAVDQSSITDPGAGNFVGYPRESIIYENTITDEDFAAYIARVFIYRYRMPKTGAAVTHTLVPVLQLGDPVYVSESTYGTVTPTTVRYVARLRHHFTDRSATTEFDTTAYPEYPSYEPREDIDIDDPAAGYKGQPVMNVRVRYTSLSGDAQQNLGHAAEKRINDTYVSVINKPITAGSPWPYWDLTGEAWPPLPGTVFFQPYLGGIGGAGDAAVSATFPADGTKYSAAPNSTFPPLQLVNAVKLTSVTITEYRRLPFVSSTDVWPVATYTLSQSTTDAAPAYYQYNPATQQMLVFLKATATRDRAWAVTVNYVQGSMGSLTQYHTNNPNHHYFNVNYSDAAKRIYLPWNHGDGTTPYQPTTDSIGWTIKYRALGADYAGGNSPFYDPYTSELGYLVDVRWDSLVSGYYRISVRSADESDTVVAWLTEPMGEQKDPEAHWEFITAGVNRSRAWDGVDNCGNWNRRQSEPYATAAYGAFEQNQKPLVGAGFYVWNREEKTDGAFAPLALISGLRDAAGKPVFGHGSFGKFYVKFEVKNDRLQQKYEEAPLDATRLMPRTVKTTALDETLNPLSATSKAALVYTHLPRPTQVAIAVADWNNANGAYDPSNTGAAGAGLNNPANWSAPTNGVPADAEARINNTRPVRVRFTVQPRPGVLWAGEQEKVSLKLSRHVHLRRTLFDQIVVMKGVNYAGTTVEDRVVLNRKLTNDDHTLVFADNAYRSASSFKTDAVDGTEWIFVPSDFRKNFRGIEDEPLQYMDYTQLDEVPYWDERNAIAGQRSRLNISFMNYLLYLSVFTADRSGRMQWALNPHFLDKSKILKNAYGDWVAPGTSATAATSSTYALPWPDDPTTQFRRSVIVRQWVDEGTWRADQRARWGLGAGSTGDKLLRHSWSDHEPGSTTLGGAAWPTLGWDEYSTYHASLSGFSDNTRAGALPATFTNLHRQLGAWNAGANTTYLGNWEWEDSPTWYPCPTRDWHGFYMVPPMVDKVGTIPFWVIAGYSDISAAVYGSDFVNYREDYCYGQVDTRELHYEGNGQYTGDDVAVAERWTSSIHADDLAPGSTFGGHAGKAFRPGTRVSPKDDGGDVKDQSTDMVIRPTTLDYSRQDEMVHWEDLRGVFSRGPRPAEQPRKVVPVQPYYINPYRYGTMFTLTASANPSYPKFSAQVTKWFEMKFRTEYLWESGTLFPTDIYGREQLGGLSPLLTRSPMKTFWDDGAWTGWKDDIPNTGEGDAAYKLYHKGLHVTATQDVMVFASGAMPVAVGPRLAVTKDMVFSLCLVNERRTTPLAV